MLNYMQTHLTILFTAKIMQLKFYIYIYIQLKLIYIKLTNKSSNVQSMCCTQNLTEYGIQSDY